MIALAAGGWIGRAVAWALGLAIALAAPSCESDKPKQRAEPGTVRTKLGAETFTLEVAATDKARSLGLMHRRSMPQDRGMLFIFPAEAERSFWMKNTHIPLDIIYVDGGSKVVSIKQMKPLDETGVWSDGPAKYAVELNQGAAARAGVKVGDVLTLPPETR
jgi:uncharacterized membrane protein (UPF0127 family)